MAQKIPTIMARLTTASPTLLIRTLLIVMVMGCSTLLRIKPAARHMSLIPMGIHYWMVPRTLIITVSKIMAKPRLVTKIQTVTVFVMM